LSQLLAVSTVWIVVSAYTPGIAVGRIYSLIYQVCEHEERINLVFAAVFNNGRTDGKPLVVQLKNPETNKLQDYYISQIIGWKDGKFIDVLDAKGFAYVVLTTEMQGKSIRLGDWVQVSNEGNNKVVCARVEDKGNGGEGGEISECAADQLGILYNRDKGVLGRLVISVAELLGIRNFAYLHSTE
jgi:hypothetical protein